MRTRAIIFWALFLPGFVGMGWGAKPPPGSSFSPLIFT